MSRDDGFQIADVDTGLYEDPKVKALARRLRDPIQTAVHVALFEALLLGSWGAGERIELEEAAPAWWTEPVDEVRANLTAVEMIDAEGRIPELAWGRWFGPAYDRRQKRRASGAKGGQTGGKGRPKPDQSDAQATPNPTVRPSDRPSTPSVDSPQPPASGGLEVNPRLNGASPRALGTNPRQIAAHDTEAAKARQERVKQRGLAAYRGAITEAERIEMNQRDAPLEEIPDWLVHIAKIRAEL